MVTRKARRSSGALLIGLLAVLCAFQFVPSSLQAARAANPSPQGPTPQGAVQLNVSYCTGGATDLKMDIYFPDGAPTGPAPVALYVHGGGWSSGDKSWIGHVMDPNLLTAKGFLVAAINYRLA